ncbi:thioredoxin domain-containing protein [Streptomyces sp. ME02-8801-2C]|uniref:DsbA family protein n=1 Tax=Streptomyces sp. ME02-8801-2C TaxID=3028680 RepID=UPI0029B77902|nr:thioredoxin domain-containing protein [Streptomyces sp. ME02-8801-2C]MDX3457317.1 thioredoxin domain-containing protein [Streptomyces sp. ME02-8801-2C]
MTVVVMSLVAGCGQRYKDSQPYESLAQTPEKLAPNGTTILVGDQTAEVTVHLYEDMRCPFCEEFETTGAGPELQRAVLRREVKVEYTLASFLDDRVGGSGSKKAANALRAALDSDRFAEYHEVLYANQPEEEVDGFTDARLLELAGQVEGLRTPAFESAVKTMKYRSFVTAAERAYEAVGDEPGKGPGTPTAVINDVRVPEELGGVLYDSKVFVKLLRAIQENPGEWQSYKDYQPLPDPKDYGY